MSTDVTDYRFVHRPAWDATARVYAATSVDASVQIGAGTVIWRYVTILENTVIGAECVIGACVFIGRAARIGDGTRIHPCTGIPNDAQIGSYVYIGSNVTLANVKVPNLRDRSQEVFAPPRIEDDVMIGANAVILPGVVIGHGARVGAGAVVTKDVPPGWTVIGNPAKRRLQRRFLFPGEDE